MLKVRCSTGFSNNGNLMRKMQRAHVKLVQFEHNKRKDMKLCLNDAASKMKTDLKEIEIIVKEFREDTEPAEIEIVDDEYFTK